MLTETCAILYVIELTDLEARGTFSDPTVYGPWDSLYLTHEPLERILGIYLRTLGNPVEYQFGKSYSSSGKPLWDETRYCFPGGRIQVSVFRKRVSVEQFRYQMQYVKEP
jgi:hypothetical protein